MIAPTVRGGLQSRRLRSLVAVACAWWCLTSVARGYEFEIDAETIGQGYQLRSGDDTLVNRRRLTQYLGLNLYNLGPHDVIGRPLDRDQFYVSVSLRFDGELGDYATLPQLSGRTPERELLPDKLDILWAFVGARNLFGFVDAKLGRQIFVDLFDFYSFDGLSVELKSPVHLAFETWGGLNVGGASPVDSPVYRTDGVSLGGNPIGSLGAREEDAYQPTFGFALKTIGLQFLQSRFSYMRTISFTGGPLQPGEPSSGVTDEKIAWTARARLLHGALIPWFGFRYNLLAGRLDEVQAGVRYTISPSHGLQLEYVFAAPTFDGDSIWNVFGAEAFNDVRLTYDFWMGRWRLFARGFARLFGDQPTSNSGAQSPPELSSMAGGGSVGARVDFLRGFARLDGYYEDGYGGTKGGVDLNARVIAFGDISDGLSFEGRVSYVHWQDDSRTVNHADSLGMQAGGRFAFHRGLSLHLLVEENINRFYASQFRAMAMLDIAFFLGPRGHGFSRPRPWSY